MTIFDLLSKAESLRNETALNSVTPERIGEIAVETLNILNEYQIQNGGFALQKVYTSVSSMQSDKSPVSDLTKKSLRRGQLVVIAPNDQADATAGDVYRYDGPSGNTSAWTFVAKIGGVPADAELNASSTNPVQNKVVTEKLTKFAGYLLPKAKIEITSGFGDGTYYRKVKIPYDTAFICGMNNTFSTSADVIVENNTSAGYLYCVVNAKTKTFRLSPWTLTLGTDEYLFFGFNVNARYATLDPYSYTINGKSNTDDISRLGGIAYIADSIPDIDDDRRVMSFPDCQFSIGKKKVSLSACQLSLNGETSSWKTILLNTVSSTVELSNYAKEVPEGCVILGNIDCSYTGSTVMGKVQRAFFPFPVSVNGKDISTSVSDLQNGKTGATIMENNGYSDYEIKFIQSKWPSKVGTASQTPRLTLCHFSDIHGSADNYNRIVEFTDAFRDHLDDVICTGDLVADNAINDFSFWKDSRILAVIGNHDSAIYSNGTYDWTGYGQVQTYNKYFKPFIASWGVTQPANAESKGLLYYYKDYTTQGVRLIALDCMFWDDAQNVWLEETLEDARVNELAVMIAVHYPKGMDTFDCPFTSLHKDSCDYLQQQPIDTVQNFIDNGGEFVAWLAGHTHLDYVGVVKGTDQLMVVVENGGLDDLWNDSKRVKGTKSQDSFNIVSVDTFDKTLTLFRIGNDRDKWLRKKDTLCIDYSANKILYA